MENIGYRSYWSKHRAHIHILRLVLNSMEIIKELNEWI